MALVPRTNTVDQAPAGTIQGGFSPRSEAAPTDMGASAWRALAGVGEQMQRAGGVLSRQAIAEQELQNETEATEAATALSRQFNEQWAGFAELQGRAATAAYPEFVERLRGMADTTLEGVSNPRVRQMLAVRVGQMTESLIGNATAWNLRQTRAANVQASEGAASEAIANGLRERNSPAGMLRALGEGLAEVRKIGEIGGWDEATLRAREAEYRGRFYSVIIDSVLNDDPTRAAEMFARVRGQMDAASQVRMEDRLAGPVRAARAAGIVANVIRPPEGEAAITDRVWRIEGGAARNPNPGQTARGGGITDGTWSAYAPRLGLTDAQRGTREGFDRVWAAYQEDARRSIGRDLTPGEQYAAWVLGIGGAKAFIMAPRDADARQVYRTVASENITEQAFRNNGRLLRDGMTVGQVLDGLNARYGAAPTRADRAELTRAALAQAGDDPQLQAAVYAQMNMWLNTLDAADTQERAAMDRRVNDLERALDLGAPGVSIPEADIRRLYEPERADAILDGLYTRQIAGQVFQSVQLATPAEIDALRTDLRDGSGPITALLRQRRGTRMEGDRVAEEDMPGDVAARGAMQRIFEQRVEQRNRDLRQDPALYALADPGVRAAAQAAASAPGNAEAMASYVTATRAAQARLGVPEHEQRILAKPQAQQIAGDLMRTDPGSGTAQNPDSPVLRLRALANTYGPAWPAVFRDLVRDGNLPPAYEVLANIPSVVGQADFARMMSAAQQAGGINKLRDALPADRRQQIERESTTYTEAFVRSATASGQTGGAVLAATLHSAVENLAVYYSLQGASPGDALQRAADRILNDKYEFQGTMRVPRTMPDGRPLGLAPVMQAQRVVMNALQPTDLADVPGSEQVPEDERRGIIWRAAQRGFWVPNETDTGLVLMMELQNGGRIPVRRRGGDRVELFYDRLPQAPAPQGVTPQRDSPSRGVTPIPPEVWNSNQ